MNILALRNLSAQARVELRKKIETKVLQLGITEENIEKESVELSDSIFIEGIQLSKKEQFQRNKLIDEINIKGYKEVIEEVAYTWFIRIIAIRFMEVNNYLPTKVLSSKTKGDYQPDIIKEALNINLHIDKNLVYKLKTSNEKQAIDKLYKYLIVEQCKELNKILPLMFEKIKGYIELLFPDGLLADGSFVRAMTDPNNIPEKSWEEVEIIGWLYQYYISERKDQVFAKSKIEKIEKEDIGPATQICTPNWIAKYMVENSLGKLWQEGHPNEGLKKQWKYYIERVEQEKEVQVKIDKLKGESKKLQVEDIKIIDPAMGSGHILVYAFDLLYDIYISQGYIAYEIPKFIIEKNLYGIDIDKRAFQLAYFALMMKGRSKNKNFLNEKVKINIIYIEESNTLLNSKDSSFHSVPFKVTSDKDRVAANKDSLSNPSVIQSINQGYLLLSHIKDPRLKKDLEYLIDVFYDAKEYGSILKVKKINFDLIEKTLEEIRSFSDKNIFQAQYKNEVLDILYKLIKQGEILSDNYDVVVTNPPYAGFRKLNNKIKNYIEEEYKQYKYDLFSVFIYQNIRLCKVNGYIGLMTPNVWQYISSYEKLRQFIISNLSIDTLIQLEDDGFKDASVSISTFVLRKTNYDYMGTFINMETIDYSGIQDKKIEKVIKNEIPGKYYTNKKIFDSLPNKQIAFWSTQNTINTFKEGIPLGEISMPRQGMATSNNNKFIRQWSEVDFSKINFNSDGLTNSDYWIPYNKGGGYRKWYGNNNNIIFWKNKGRAVKKYAENLYGNYSRTIKNERFYFKKGITYSFIGKYIGPRYTAPGFIFDVAGSTIFLEEDLELNYIMAILASKLSKYYMDILNPSLNIQVGNLKNIPIIFPKKDEDKNLINALVNYNISISKLEWDSFETSWDFKIHPFLKYLDLDENYKLYNIFSLCETETEEAFNQLKYNEEELNRILINIYGLEEELRPEIEDKYITISKANRERDVKSFISYAVGCMFGRYSLDEEGLVYAGGKFNHLKYKMFPVCKNNIIPILLDSYFEDDIVCKFEDFLKIVYSEETLNENLKYIADSLGVRKNESPRQTIGRYFVNDFYKNHNKIYKKRPIYWLFSSGKEKAFNALIYIHRYDESTLARIRADYLNLLQSSLEVEKAHLEDRIAYENNVEEIKEYKKQLKNLEKKIVELKEYDEKLYTMTNQMIALDLDEGVKVNYEKFEGLIQKI